MVGNHDVLVATARADGESAHVVGEELTDGPDPDVKFVGSGVGKWAFDAVDGWKGGSWIGFLFLRLLDRCLCLVERTPCQDCMRCPLMVSA